MRAMNIQTISEILAAEDSDIILKKIVVDVTFQGLSAEEAHFLLSHDKNTTVYRFLSALAYSYLNEHQKAIQLLDTLVLENQAVAMVSRAHMYRQGHGTADHQPDYAQAILLLDRAIAQGDTQAMNIRADMYINGRGTVCDKFSYSSAMDLITQSLCINPSSRINSIKYLLTSLMQKNHLDAEYFLFINLYKPDGYFPHDKTAALALFQKHPIEHFATFCQTCIDEIKEQALTEEAHHVQIEHINALLSLIPKSKETPAVQAAINRFMGHAALFISRDIPASYEYFRAVPEAYLLADDLGEISHEVWLNQTNNDHQDTNINLALELAQYAQEKSPSDKGAIRLNNMLSKLYLKKNMFTQSDKVSPHENLQLHARTQGLNRGTQQISVLKEYQSYLLLKSKFEPQQSVGLLGMWAPVDNSKCVQDAVATLIHRLDHGNTLEHLLVMPDIENARQKDASFEGVINQLMKLSFLPAQDLKIEPASCDI